MKNLGLKSSFLFSVVLFLVSINAAGQDCQINHDSTRIGQREILKGIDSTFINHLEQNICIVYYYLTYSNRDYFMVFGDNTRTLTVEYSSNREKRSFVLIDSVKMDSMEDLPDGIYFLESQQPDRHYFDYLFIRVNSKSLTIYPTLCSIRYNLKCIKEEYPSLYSVISPIFELYNKTIKSESYYSPVLLFPIDR